VIGVEDKNHDLGLNDPEVAMPPLLNLLTAPEGCRCILTLFSVAAH
jgi:hypothetical protein